MTTLNNRPSTQPLTGNELLEKINELGDVSKSEMVRACGYVSYNEDGTPILKFTEFFEELLYAKGINISQPSATDSQVQSSEESTDVPDAMETIDDDTLHFAIALPVLLRRFVMKKWYGVQTFSEADDAGYRDAFVGVYKAYNRMRLHEYGIGNMNLIKEIHIRAFAYNGPSSIDRADRMEYLRGIYECIEEDCGMIRGRLIEEAADDVVANSKEYAYGLAHALCGVLRTESHNKFNDAGWELVPAYHRDKEYLSEQLAWLHNGNNPSQFSAAKYAVIGAMTSDPMNDKFDLDNFFEWLTNRIQELLLEFPQDKKAVGRYGPYWMPN